MNDSIIMSRLRGGVIVLTQAELLELRESRCKTIGADPEKSPLPESAQGYKIVVQ